LFEICTVKLKTVATSLGIGCIYRAPSGNINQVLELLDVTLECSLWARKPGDHIPVWGGGEIFHIHLGWPWGTPSLLYGGYRGILGGKAAGAWH